MTRVYNKYISKKLKNYLSISYKIGDISYIKFLTNNISNKSNDYYILNKLQM